MKRRNRAKRRLELRENKSSERRDEEVGKNEST